ncbi:LpqB family beta-propeller domain-containing protein [Streptomyces sp. NRRL F-5123]|uniref:LpqB family beta-propeller domain-containing protein n=1 Tax=Streptomyces sp. NRRL F-5123 TaxID=1463856 RepID=UPI0004E0B97D|nr:LpqB family beta-propeller domain-containing protein [Streptomyces sp. NRRL F-5123]
MALLGGRAGRAARVALPLSAALLLAGCASMPSGGEVSKVDDSQQAEGDTQVRVFGIPPRAHEQPWEIVNGFLEATTSGETDFATAKQYLAADLKKRWKPLAGITVLSTVPRALPVSDPGPKATVETISLDNTQTAKVDAGYAYRLSSDLFHEQVHLVKQNGEWRIDDLNDGLLLSAADFQRIYHSVNMYYFAAQGSGDRQGGGRQTLIADPVYLRRQQPDALSATVTALLGGPSEWLAPVADTAAPAGARLHDGRTSSVSLDDSQRLQVRLDKVDKLHGEACRRLAAQIFATVQGQSSVQLSSVEVQRTDGTEACTIGSGEAGQYGPGNLVGGTSAQFYIGSAKHNLIERQGASTSGYPVRGPLGADKANLLSVAVRRDGRLAAAVRSDGRQLVVASLADGAAVQTAPLTSAAQDPRNGLSAPSWDGFDDLWVADRNPAVSRLYVLPAGTGQPVAVGVPELEGRIESLRVASDGLRIALVVSEGGKDRLMLGRIDRGGTPEQPQFAVHDLRDITPAGESVLSASWAGASRLVVLGSDSAGSGQQIQWVSTDGSVSLATDTIGEADSVAASEDPDPAAVSLLASSHGSVYWQSPDLNWKKVTPPGASPVYPG